VLAVQRLTAGTPADELLAVGDLLLEVNGSPVAQFREVERASRAEWVDFTVLRDGRELVLRIPTVRRDGLGTRRAFSWAGALLQAPPPAVSAQRGAPPEGVYVAWIAYGSPAHRFALHTTNRITAANGSPTPDLDAFLAAVAETPDGGSVRLKTIDLDGKVHVSTLKLDLQFWPTTELQLTDRGWTRRTLELRPGP
jgi:S1-C subfamily serine protease